MISEEELQKKIVEWLELRKTNKSLEKAKHDPGRKAPAVEGHHTIPVAENLDWHLKNLWETPESKGGYRSIKDIPKAQHKEIHAQKQRGVKPKSASDYLKEKSESIKKQEPKKQYFN